MADVHIKSENQSGGITAQNVNSPTQFTTTPTRRPQGGARKFFWWVFGIAGIVAAVAAVLALYKGN